ncbi:MAG TPA: tRNA (guanosine(46)-N7)-methyltransferase TrmB [Thermodesulfobacteriota bacterium]|nr:tRNA (guanosine(46)-N7)-methyltransferase TrmB [Thermodesulfobacteriota bacterium]
MAMHTSSPILDVTEYYLPLDLSEVFGSPKELALEVGFGDGGFITEMARRKEDWNFIGIEIKRKRLIKAAKRAERENLQNVKLLLMDAKIALEEIFTPLAFSTVYINFPDPWPKDRHKKHRIINPGFLEVLSRVLKNEALVEIASDHQEYISHIIETFEKTKLFRNEFPLPGYRSAMPNRPMTKYEIEFKAEGREIYYLRFMKIGKNLQRR